MKKLSIAAILMTLLAQLQTEPVLAQSYQTCTGWRSRIEDRLRQIEAQGRNPQTDPALIALIQQIASSQQATQQQLLSTQAAILAAIAAERQATPAVPPLALVLPQQGGGGGTLQQLPIAGAPQQVLPIQGTPLQQVPIQGAPLQSLPQAGAPLQNIIIQGPPQQTLPVAPPVTAPSTPGGSGPSLVVPGPALVLPTPAPKPGQPVSPLQSLPSSAGGVETPPTGYQRYTQKHFALYR